MNIERTIKRVLLGIGDYIAYPQLVKRGLVLDGLYTAVAEI